MWTADSWREYEVIDCGGGEKLERWGDALLLRPDPQAIWPAGGDLARTAGLSAHYHRSASGGGEWEVIERLPEKWRVGWENMVFQVGLMGFKHTGLFPEQAVNWEWMTRQLKGYDGTPEVLNLFGYTGAATAACAMTGAKVVHVDASKGMTQWARENLALNCPDAPVRWIVEDCLAFVRREARRGRTYQGLLMDPPSYGRGPGGQMWKLEDSIYELLRACTEILAQDAVFFLLNSYTTGLQASVLTDLLKLTVGKMLGGHVVSDELGLPVTRRDIVLPCGASGRWTP